MPTFGGGGKVLPFGHSRQERIQRVEIVFTINFDHTVSLHHVPSCQLWENMSYS